MLYWGRSMAIIGIDIGTQSVKVVLTDDALAVIGDAAHAIAVDYPRPGWAQQDPRDFEAGLRRCVGAALAEADLPASAVRAVGVSGQLDGCVGVAGDGRAATPCLIWMDRRAADEVPAEFVGDGAGAAEFARTTGLVADATHMAAKIRWLKRHAPAADHYHQPVSYLVERLTGERVFDHGLASTTMLYSLARRGYDEALLDAFAIETSELPEIRDAAAPAGRLSRGGAELLGLGEDVLVAVGTGDDFATPLGAGLVGAGPVACVVGTAEVVGALHPEAVFDARGLVETHGYANHCFFIENPGWLSGGAMAWLGKLLGGSDFAALDAAAAAVPAGADGLLFLPALSGAMAPEWIASARGCFYGLTAAHGRGHLARAVMEGCAFAMRDVVERLGELGVAAESISMLGGGARSALWGQIRADVSGLPVAMATRVDTCPLGAAMLAAVAAGIQPDLERCAELVVGQPRLVHPDPGRRAVYDQAHARYRLLFASLRPLY